LPGQFVFAASWLHATALDGLRSVVDRYSLRSGALTLLIGSAGLPPLGVALARNLATATRPARDLLLSPLFLAVCLISTAIVFVVGNDWNRWLYIVTSILTMMHFAIRCRAQEESAAIVTGTSYRTVTDQPRL
jgi:hypothetical protein